MHTMTATIGRLRALLLDEGWSEDHRADALRTLAEIEAAWDALLAPDVEAALGALLGAMRGVPPSCAADVADVLRPLVEDRARLAREVERLTETLAVKSHMAKVLAEDHRKARNALDAARAEIARLTSDLDSLAADVGQALCAATLRPGETITDQRPHAIVSLVVGLVAEKHAQVAEIARLTADLARIRESFGSTAPVEALRKAAVAACADPANRAMGDVRDVLATEGHATPLSPTGMLNAAQKMAGAHRTLERLDKEIADLKEAQKDERSAAMKDRATFAKEVDTGSSWSLVPCREKHIFRQRTVEVYRLDRGDPDVGELIETRAMTPEELEKATFEVRTDERVELPAGDLH